MLSRGGTLQLTGAGAALIAVCYGLARFAYGLFVPVFRTEFALDATVAGTIASGSYAAYCVAIVTSTVLTPRYGGRAVAVAAGCIATGGVLMIAAAPGVAVLAAGVLIAGSSTGVASPPLAYAVAHNVAEARRARTQTVINAGTGLGVAVAGPVALLSHEQWRAAWLVFAVLCALVTLWAGTAVPAGPRIRGTGPALLPHPPLPAGSGRLLAAAGLMGAASAAVWTFGRDVLVSRGGMSEQLSTIAWILLGVFGMLGATAGDVVERLGIRTAWPVTMVVLAAASWSLAVFPGNLAVAWTAAAVCGAAYIALTGLLLVWGTEVYPHAPAADVGLASQLTALGQAMGVPLVDAVE
ncbi:MFS transporter [Propionibacterium australiense]|uniref:Major facilitator superfamily domain n=1 Tax=Propionibacterium australiense TaxID=119981 RepID=A0A383S9E3_9ACTN|nr:MFS transporter [Propionibacterium australiense]RLP09584.1 YbfB/YjiJ family MFS transporter [Propionibacterium australiense]RLP12286.1 YbfB/YjiJ family MFS transporter [Propionibacterium australiense]SYZ34537.1 Major facilitator superfamily domain [Propionibacterium australiense]VEH89687.1 Arabinose efflux permease [Propionibacterium australiense]